MRTDVVVSFDGILANPHEEYRLILHVIGGKIIYLRDRINPRSNLPQFGLQSFELKLQKLPIEVAPPRMP